MTVPVRYGQKSESDTSVLLGDCEDSGGDGRGTGRRPAGAVEYVHVQRGLTMDAA